MEKDREYFLNQLIKFHINLVEDLYNLNKNLFKGKEFSNISQVSFEIIYLFLILKLTKSYKATFNVLSKTKNNKDVFELDSFLKKCNKEVRKLIDLKLICNIKLSVYLFNELFEFILKSSFKAQIIGDFYEKVLGIKFRFKNQKIKVVFDNSLRKQKGIFYTPQSIVELMISEVFVDKKKSNESPYLRVFDPSCGTGNFLLAFFNNFISLNSEKKANKNISKKQISLFTDEIIKKDISLAEKRNIIKKFIFGIDIDPVAIRLLKTIFLLKLYENEKDFKIDKSLFRILDKNLIVGNFINLFENEKDNILYKIYKQGFDVIIGNPPWVTIRKSEIGKRKWDELRKKYKSVSVFKFNLFPIFLEKCINLMKKNTSISFIIPQRLLDAPSYFYLRKIMIDQKLIRRISKINSTNFNGVVADSVIIFLDKEEKSFIEIMNYDANNTLLSTDKLSYESVQLCNYKIITSTSSHYKGLLTKIEKQSKELKNYFFVHVGMMVKNRKDMLKNYDTGVPIVTSKCFYDYSVIKPKFVDLSKAKIYGGLKDIKKHSTTPKLLVKKTGNKIISTLEPYGSLIEQSCYLLLPKFKFDLFFFLALLNSKLINFYYRINLISNPVSFPYIQHYDLEKLPLFDCEKTISKKQLIEEISDETKKIISLEQSFLQKGKSRSKTLIEKKKNNLNEMIYKLYDLSQSEINEINLFEENYILNKSNT